MSDQQRREWEKDDLSKPRIFTIAGFPTSSDRANGKKQLIKDIESMRGIVLETEVWDSRVTHVIAFNQDMTEKVMAAIAAGRWVVSVKFVTESKAKGDWLESPRPFVCHDVVLHHRKKWFSKGFKGGLFYGMKAALMLDDSVKNGVYKRVIEAGGGTISSIPTLSLYKELKNGELTHVFIDPWITKPTNSRNKIFEKFRKHVSEFEPKIEFLWYKYLYQLVRISPGIPSKPYSIFDKKVQKQSNPEEKLHLQRKRKKVTPFERQPKKLKEDVITIESSDEEEPLPVEISIEESDDDIEVLEQRLGNKQNIHGSMRVYMEKTTTRVKEEIIDISEEQIDNIDLVSDSDDDLRDEVDKQIDPQRDDDNFSEALKAISDSENKELRLIKKSKLKENTDVSQDTVKKIIMSVTKTKPVTIISFNQHIPNFGKLMPNPKLDLVEVNAKHEFDKLIFQKQERNLRNTKEQNSENDNDFKLKLLSDYTSYHKYPNPRILNFIFKNYFGSNRSKCIAAYSYVTHLVGTSYDRYTRNELLKVILSSMRYVDDPRIFSSFDLENQQDIFQVWQYTKTVINKACEVSIGSGHYMLLDLIIKLFQTDLHLWWKMRKKTPELHEPLIFYAFGSHKFAENAIYISVQLYQESIKSDNVDRNDARLLVGLVGFMLLQIDKKNNEEFLYQGLKVSLASSIASALKSENLSENELFIELNLLQSSWLSALVSWKILDINKSLHLSQTRNLFISENFLNDGPKAMVLENYSKKLISLTNVHVISRIRDIFITSKDKDQTGHLKQDIFKLFNNFQKLSSKDELSNTTENYGIKYKTSKLLEDVDYMCNYIQITKDFRNISITPLKCLWFDKTLPHDSGWFL